MNIRWIDADGVFVHYPKTKNSNARQVKLHEEIVSQRMLIEIFVEWRRLAKLRF